MTALTLEFPSINGWTEHRGGYGEISHWTHGADVLRAPRIIELFKPALPETYIEGSKREVESLNLDLYGYDYNQQVAIIQARHAWWHKRKNIGTVHKTYFLTGYNELTHEPFRHPVSAFPVRGCIRSRAFRESAARSVEVVRAAQKWMWDVTDAQLSRSVRQGDVLVVPEPRFKPASAPSVPIGLMLADSHRVAAEGVVEQDDRLYALNPRLEHVKDQHLPVSLEGWCSLRVGRDVKAWNFAVRLGD